MYPFFERKKKGYDKGIRYAHFFLWSESGYTHFTVAQKMIKALLNKDAISALCGLHPVLRDFDLKKHFISFHI